jgi:hypothetical protein
LKKIRGRCDMANPQRAKAVPAPLRGTEARASRRVVVPATSMERCGRGRPLSLNFFRATLQRTAVATPPSVLSVSSVVKLLQAAPQNTLSRGLP